MKMSAFPLPVTGYPNLATTQLLMSAAGGLNIPNSPGAGSPKDIPGSAMSAAHLPGLAGRVPGIADMHVAAAGHGCIPPQLAAMAGMADPRLLYSALGTGYDMKDNADALMAWRQIAAQAQAASAGLLPYDTHAAAVAAASFPYAGYPGMDINGARRKNATRETTSTLKAWLYEHRKNPYPTKGEKIMLAIVTKMTLTQVSTWFANARRRLKKENKMTWSPRNRTDDGSDDGDEKVDEETGEDDVSIDLSDFESETSPQKSTANLTNAVPSEPSAAQPSARSPQASPTAKDSSKPRIWSIADVAASKPSPSLNEHKHMHISSMRHRPYPIPSTVPAFRPWFDNSYRQLATQQMLGNPLLPARPNPVQASLRVPIASPQNDTAEPQGFTATTSTAPDKSTTDSSLENERQTSPMRKEVKLERSSSSPGSSH